MSHASPKHAAPKKPPKKNPPVRRALPDLADRWDRLHETDCEPYPDEQYLSRLAAKQPHCLAYIQQHSGPARYAEQLQQAWAAFHAGKFLQAIELGAELGALGASAANKSAAVYSLSPTSSDAAVMRLLEQAVTRGEAATRELPEYANAHYNLALVLGRYSQRISILKALADGLASRVHQHLQKTLELEPKHAEAHIALGLYHAEIIGKLGALAARLTYGASSAKALEHFQRAIKLAPDSPIARIEYANGLLRLDAHSHGQQARELYAQAAACEPADAMERLDVARAKRGIKPA